MLIKDLFKKEIDRNIEGVIKASDDTHIFDEVSEYVITREIEKNLNRLFDAYNDYKGANGVWISGFFGSGKSHLLKMLSYLLENRNLDNAVPVADIFLEKIDGDELLKGSIKKATSIPSKSILFNIDEKAVVISKTQIDAILSVFLQVFNEMMGYHPKADYLAEFERDLDCDGLYEQFKSAYHSEAGKPWTEDRKRVHRQKNELFAKVYSSVKKDISYEESLKLLDRYKDDYQISIDDFTTIIKEYIDRQPKGFRLNFFVDEVGQFIADNTKLMTNLQTIAESLATKCKGQSWVFVTSQQDVESLIGEMGSTQGNDFSKIMDRFKNRLPLNSADVAEVIQKRLLSKSTDGQKYLLPIYEQEKNNFKTLFEFTSDSRQYKLFTGEKSFYDCYPFTPYQFVLFQSTIMGISKNNGFEGHYRSVGERSMLSVFQQVAKDISQSQTGVLATFDKMFSGLTSSLKSEIQNSILQAERSDLSELQVQVLKALFLVKFVKEFKPNLHNISILLFDTFTINIKNHQNKIKEALAELEIQTYIQRSGELFEFLTDKEKSIENEIKATEISSSDITSLFTDFLYKNTIRDNKVRYDVNKEDYPFTRKLNDMFSGQEKELSMNILTSDHDSYGNHLLLSTKSMGKAEMLVVLDSDSRLHSDMAMYMKTDKYIRLSQSSTLSDEDRKLLAAKGAQNQERKIRLQQRIAELLSKGTIYINGQVVTVSSSDPRTKVMKGFQELIKVTYPNLRMIPFYRASNIQSILNDSDDDFLINLEHGIGENEQEVINFITRNKMSSERTTLKSTLNHFSKRPYGWPPVAVQCTIVSLFKHGKIEVKQDSTILEKDGLGKNIINTASFSNTAIELQEEFNNRDIKSLKELHSEMFHESNTGSDAKAVALLFQEKIRDTASSIRIQLNSKSSYTFLDKLESVLIKFKQLGEKDYKYYLKNLVDFEDDFMELVEDIITPIFTFMEGKSRTVYDQILDFTKEQNSNLPYLEDIKLVESLHQIKEHPKPYASGVMRSAKDNFDKLLSAVEKKRQEFITEATKDINSLRDKFQSFDDFEKLTESEKQRVLSPFERAIESLSNQKLIPVIKDIVVQQEGRVYQDQIKLMIQLAKPPVQPKTKEEIEHSEPPQVVKEKASVKLSSLRPHFSKPVLESEEDVDKYITEFRKKLMMAITSDNNIDIF